MKLRALNTKKFIDGILDHVDRTKKSASNLRRQAAEMLVEEMLGNIPVWSGGTAGSITVSNSGAVTTLGKGDWRMAADYGPTNSMDIGEEPMRPQAEARARATIASTDFSLDKKVYVTVGSEIWDKVNQGQAPGGPGQRIRNKAVVSELAKAAVKARFKGVK